MSSQKRVKSNQPRRPKPRATRNDVPDSGSVRLSDAKTERPSPLMAALTYAGYMTAIWLIFQTVNEFKAEPTFGFVWSPAVLGIVVGAATAVVKDERGVRTRLGIQDFSSRRATLVWGGLGLLGIFAIMTLPQY